MTRDLRAQEESNPEEKLLIFIKLAQASQQNLAKETNTYTPGSEVHARVKEITWKNEEMRQAAYYTIKPTKLYTCLLQSLP